MGDFKMPSLGADMDAGTLVEWRVKPGDTVKRGDVVALVETEKGIIEVEIWEGGVVSELVVAPGTKVAVGATLARLDGGVRRVLASPAAKQFARERAVDIDRIAGTGPHGVVTRADVEKAAAPRTEPQPKPELDMTAMRHAIAAAMARSKREIPHYYLSTDVDLGRAVAWLTTRNESRPVTERVLMAAVLLKATALAVREVPEMNGFYEGDAFRPSAAIHVGVAVSMRQGGLIAPALHDVDRKSIDEVQTAMADLVARVRGGHLRSSEMTDATITVTNLGEQGVTSVLGVIYPPQVALVGFGKVTERPWAEHGMLGVRPVVNVSLAADHRASDGHRGAVFLAALDRLLQKPEAL